jgi:adenosine deaminase
MKKKEFCEFLKSIPKAELHVHQEAVLDRRTIKKVYARNFGRELSGGELDALFGYTDLPGFLSSFISIQSYFSKIEDLADLFGDFENYLNKNNIVYCETFFSPTSHLKKGWSFHEIISVIDEAIKKIKNETGRTVKILIDVSRSFGFDNAMKNLDLVLAEKNPDIIGIGLGGDEIKGPAKDFAEVFQKAKANGLHTVIHAGETDGIGSMKDALDLCGAERLGHGIACVDDENFMRELAEKKVPLEVCPTSNVFLLKKFSGRIKNHPAKKIFDAGIPFTLNTDDPTFFKTSLLDEYWKLYHDLNFSPDEICRVVKNAFEFSFMEKSEKEKFIQQVDEAWTRGIKNFSDEV